MLGIWLGMGILGGGYDRQQIKQLVQVQRDIVTVLGGRLRQGGKVEKEVNIGIFVLRKILVREGVEIGSRGIIKFGQGCRVFVYWVESLIVWGIFQRDLFFQGRNRFGSFGCRGQVLFFFRRNSYFRVLIFWIRFSFFGVMDRVYFFQVFQRVQCLFFLEFEWSGRKKFYLFCY